jgi:hypothetical protein
MHFEVAPGMGNVDIFRRLQDLMIQIPPLLETFDTLAIADINKKAEETVLTRILHRCSSLHAQLLAWYEVLSEQIPGQLYSSSPSKAHSPADLFGTRIFPLAFEFPSLNIAQLLLLYWSTLIVLYRTMQDIDKREQKTRNETDDAEHPPRLLLQYSASDSDPTFTQHFNPSCPSTNHVALLAKKICQSFEYCYKSTNSTISVQYTVFPRWVVQEFYASRPEYDRQLAWCEEVHNMTAPGSRFDLGFTKFGNLNEV